MTDRPKPDSFSALAKAYDGDLDGVRRFLELTAQTANVLACDHLLDGDRGIEIRLRQIASDSEKAAEYVSGVIAGKQMGQSDD